MRRRVMDCYKMPSLVNLVIFSVLTTPLSAGSFEDAERLLQEVVASKDRRVRPLVDQSETMVVYIDMKLHSVYEVEEVQQRLSTIVVFKLYWRDEIRTWDPSKYGNISIVVPEPTDIWRPRFFVTDSVDKRAVFDDDYAPLSINYTGWTSWSPGGVIQTSCLLKMTYFPFDEHVCSITLVAGETRNMTYFKRIWDVVSLDILMFNGQWTVESTSSHSIDGTPAFLTVFRIHLRRRPAFVLINLLAPINVISHMSCLVFLFPIESGERVSFSTTVLLSLTVYSSQIYSDLPRNSESLPHLVIYLTALLVHSCLTIIANLVVMLHASRTSSVRGQNSSATFSTDSPGGADGVHSQVEFEPLVQDSQIEHQIPSVDQFRRHDASSKEYTTNGKQRGQNPGTGKIAEFIGNILSKFGINSSRKRYPRDGVRSEIKGSFSCLLAKILLYVRPVDLLLFFIFLGMWVICFVVFMAVISLGG